MICRKTRPEYCKLHYRCGGIAVEGCCCCNDCNYFKNGRMEPILRPNEANINDVMIIYEDHIGTTNRPERTRNSERGIMRQFSSYRYSRVSSCKVFECMSHLEYVIDSFFHKKYVGHPFLNVRRSHSSLLHTGTVIPQSIQRHQANSRVTCTQCSSL